MMKTRLQRILATALLGTSLCASAAEGDYEVELLIFAQNSYGGGTLPYDATAAGLTPPPVADAAYLQPYNGAPFSQLEMLPGERLTLTDDATRLRRQGYEILWHGGWFQHVSTGRNPSIRLSSNDGRVDGVVKVDRNRYLHLRPDLLLSRSSAVEAKPQQYRLQQSRRMRSEKLHYLDHPHFGILAIINPVEE
jgi:hypothetical protein